MRAAPANFVKALGAILFGGFFLEFMRNPPRILREPDLFWHIKTGLDAIASHHLPTVDTYSWTQAGQPWIAKEWLSQIIFAVTYDVAGWVGPLVLACLVAAATAGLMFRFLARDLAPLFAGALVVIVIFELKGVTVARPHLFTFPLLVIFTATLFSAARDVKPPPWWTLALIVLWVNLHASFPLAFIIAGFAFLDIAERSRLKDMKLLTRWMVFGVLCLGAALINPYFLQPLLITADLARGIDVMAAISEWQPFSPSANPLIELGFMAILAILLGARARLTLARIGFVLFTFHLMLTHIRFIYVFFLATPLVITPEISTMWTKLSLAHWQQNPRDALESLLAKYWRFCAGLAALAATGATAVAMARDLAHPPTFVTNKEALAYIDAHKTQNLALQGHVLNEYNLGGPLILHGIKTYVDGRADQIFQGDFIRTYLASAQTSGKEALHKILSDPAITWTLFFTEDPRNAEMAKLQDWQKTFGNDDVVIFERKAVSP